jgi:hypothetical protein
LARRDARSGRRVDHSSVTFEEVEVYSRTIGR